MDLLACFAAVILTFAPVFVQQRTWRHAELLLIGAILAPGKRTVTSLLRIAGLSRERRFTTYHRVLNRAGWGRPRGGTPAARPPDRRRRAERPCAAGHRRHDRASAGQADQRQRHLPRPGPVLEGSLREGQWPALAEPDAPGPGPVGRAHLGASVPHRAGTFGALLPRARQAAQEADGLGTADGAASAAMAAWARDCAAGRQQLRCIGFPGDTGPATPDLHHAPAAPRGLVRGQTPPAAPG